MFSMGKRPLRDPMSVNCLGFSTNNFHQVLESSSINIEENENSDNNLPQRYALDRSNSGRKVIVQWHSNLHFITCGILSEFEKVHFEPCLGKRISWPKSKLPRGSNFTSS